MARQPQQVHIYLYRKNTHDENEFCILQRSDNTLYWQGICGGVEEGETIEQGARREIYEEAGIITDLPLYRLDTISYLPSNIFGKKIQEAWGDSIVVVPMYFFAMPYNGEVNISNEHNNFKWCRYNEAKKLVYWHDQKTALWELNERLWRGNLIR